MRSRKPFGQPYVAFEKTAKLTHCVIHALPHSTFPLSLTSRPRARSSAHSSSSHWQTREGAAAGRGSPAWARRPELAAVEPAGVEPVVAEDSTTEDLAVVEPAVADVMAEEQGRAPAPVA